MAISLSMDSSAITATFPTDRATDGLSATENELRRCFVRGLAGDAAQYRRFLDSLGSHLRAYLRRRLPRAQADVEDILQETLLAVHNARHTYRDDQPLTAWVHAIARYKLMDFFRAHSRREALHEPFEDDGSLFVQSDVEPADARRDVGRLLEQLPDRHRLPIVFVKLQGLSVAEAAQRCGISESAVKVGVHRGLKALAARIRGSS
jgi:RNA polymerase sigma-70 factor, ECF subfamily